jgi:hypothetical protein
MNKSATTLNSNPNDRIRDAILRHLYNVHQKAKSPKSAAIGIRDLCSALKELGYKQQEVASNLDYLLQKGWVRDVVENRTFTTPRGTTQQAEKITYKISDVGIDRLESASTYRRPDISPHINVTNIQGVTVVGDGNVVNTNFTEVSRLLSEMRTAVLGSTDLLDTTKLEVAADIDTLQAQLQKPSPDKSIVKPVWNAIEKTVTAAGFVDLVGKIGALLGLLIS